MKREQNKSFSHRNKNINRTHARRLALRSSSVRAKNARFQQGSSQRPTHLAQHGSRRETGGGHEPVAPRPATGHARGGEGRQRGLRLVLQRHRRVAAVRGHDDDQAAQVRAPRRGRDEAHVQHGRERRPHTHTYAPTQGLRRRVSIFTRRAVNDVLEKEIGAMHGLTLKTMTPVAYQAALASAKK